MAIVKFKDYAHDTYERGETLEHLVEQEKVPREVAEHLAERYKPMYEVGATFEFDTETETLRVVEAEVGGVRMVPAGENEVTG